MEKLAYSVSEVGKVGGGGRTKVYEAINDGSLKAKKRGKSTIILAHDLASYLENLPDYEPEADT